MSALVSRIDFDFILNSFDWASFPAAKVVDVGGGHGTVSIGLAQRLPTCRFIIQDLGHVVKASRIPAELADRVSTMPYNFLDAQPVEGADVYYFRNIFHNWPDESCIAILRAQVSALKPRSRLLIDDFSLHEPLTLPPYEERRRR
jgi:O-methyltransferase domain